MANLRSYFGYEKLSYKIQHPFGVGLMAYETLPNERKFSTILLGRRLV